jgi:predicted DNA binding CopG/RHH family protein
MLAPGAFPEFNNSQQFFKLIDAVNQAEENNPDDCLCIDNIRDQACLEDQQRVNELLKFHFTAEIKKDQITLRVPEHDLEVKHPDYRQGRQIISDLVFMEVKRKFYCSPLSLEEEMLLLLKEFELPFNNHSYQWQVNQIGKVYPTKETVEYLLGNDWPAINKMVEFIID